jgi:hypothetical protein
MSPRAITITGRDFEVLGELEAAVRWRKQFSGLDWVQPMELGGSNGSDHSYRLTKLARAGLVEQKQRSSYGRRGSKSYTITEVGLKALTARKAR